MVLLSQPSAYRDNDRVSLYGKHVEECLCIHFLSITVELMNNGQHQSLSGQDYANAYTEHASDNPVVIFAETLGVGLPRCNVQTVLTPCHLCHEVLYKLHCPTQTTTTTTYQCKQSTTWYKTPMVYNRLT